MPQKHKYKCLNPNHFDAYPEGTREREILFIAMNNEQICPLCGSRKLEDWGEVSASSRLGMFRSQQASFGKAGAGARIDNTLRGLADSFGMTDINNKGGQAAKRAPEQGRGEFGTMKIMGAEVPIDREIRGGWAKTNYSPFSLPAAKDKFPGRRGIPTSVVAKHTGK